jgi:hypothetical protein
MQAEAVLAAPEARPAEGRPAEGGNPAPTQPPVQRWVWQSRNGTIVIEVRGNDAYVNGQKVVMATG